VVNSNTPVASSAVVATAAVPVAQVTAVASAPKAQA